jgi:hypothetical protein
MRARTGVRRIIRRRRTRTRRWMSSSTRCPTILTHRGWYCCRITLINQQAVAEVINPNQ